MMWMKSISALCAAMLLIGCSATPPGHDDLGPTVDRQGRARSLALDSGRQRKITDQPAGWWTTRNDYARSTAVEQDGLVYDIVVDRTYDNLHTHNGNVHDHYHSTSRKTRVRRYAP